MKKENFTMISDKEFELFSIWIAPALIIKTNKYIIPSPTWYYDMLIHKFLLHLKLNHSLEENINIISTTLFELQLQYPKFSTEEILCAKFELYKRLCVLYELNDYYPEDKNIKF